MLAPRYNAGPVSTLSRMVALVILAFVQPDARHWTNPRYCWGEGNYTLLYLDRFVNRMSLHSDSGRLE